MNKVKKLLPIFILFFFLLPFSTHAANKYYNNAASDGDWNNPLNWWDDAGFSVPGTVPGVGDDAFVTENVFLNGGAPASVNTLDVTGAAIQFFVDITTSSGASFNNTASNFGIITGDAIFNNTTVNYGVVTGTATFNLTSYNDSPGTVATAFFNNSSYNNTNANVSGLATFANTSYNLGNLLGNAIFNGTSYNSGGVSGDATFNPTYSAAAAPSGGIFTISGTNIWSGVVTGNMIGSDATVITSVVFKNDAHNDATLHIATRFDDSSYNRGTINAAVTFNTDYYNGVVPTNHILTVGGSVIWEGNISGTLYGSDALAINDIQFRSTAGNVGYLNSTSTFFDSSYNQGTISANATFYDTSVNDPNATGAPINGNAYFHDASHNFGVGVIDPNGYFYDNSYNAGMGVGYGYFYNSSYNDAAGIVIADAHFFDSSYNDGLVQADAYAHCPMNLPVAGAGTINGTSYHVGCELYYNAGVDTDWNTLGNWWNDAAFTSPATYIPASDDTVHIYQNVLSNSGPAISVIIATIQGILKHVDVDMMVTGNAILYDSAYLVGTITGDTIFDGDATEMTPGLVIGTKTRHYTADTTTTRGFVTTGPWILQADGTGVEVNVAGATYDGGTTFSEMNGGIFVYTAPVVPPPPAPSPSSSPRQISYGGNSIVSRPTPVIVSPSVLPAIVPETTPTTNIVTPPKTPSTPAPVTIRQNQNPVSVVSTPTPLVQNNIVENTNPAVIRESVNTYNSELVAGVFTFVGIATFVYATIANLISTYLPNTEFASIPMRVWTAWLGLFGFKRKGRPWGTVYDSVTKQPLDPALVTLLDENGKEIKTAITDIDGRYGFVLDKGSYTMTAGKSNYIFPSKKMAGMKADELYSNLYFGEKFTSAKSGELDIRNIPMDQENFDWNEYAKRQAHMMRFYTKRTLWTQRIIDVLFLLGLFSTAIVMFFVPNTYNAIALGLYLIMTFLHMSGITSKAFGVIRDERTGLPLSFAIITVFSEALDAKMSEKVTDKYGKYYCLIPAGRYYVTVQKKNSDGTYSLVYKSSSFDAKNGVIRNDFEV